MTALKWAGLLIAALVTAADTVTNLLVAPVTGMEVPPLLNMLAVGLAAGLALTAFMAHLYARLDTKLDFTIELMVARFDEIEHRIGDPETGVVNGCRMASGRGDGSAGGPGAHQVPGPHNRFENRPVPGQYPGSAAEPPLPAGV